MSKLQLTQDFILEVGSDKYKGSFKDLTKKQNRELESKSDKVKKQHLELQKETKKIAKLDRKILIAEKQQQWAKIDKLEKDKESIEEKLEVLSEALSEVNILEDIFKARLEASIEGEDKQKILEIGDEYGYERVFNTILEDIRERTEKK